MFDVRKGFCSLPPQVRGWQCAKLRGYLGTGQFWHLNNNILSIFASFKKFPYDSRSHQLKLIAMKKSVILALSVAILFQVTLIKKVTGQNDTVFWNPDMQAIAKPSSKEGWVLFKDDSQIPVATLFTSQKPSFGLGVDEQMAITRTETDQLGYTHCRYQQTYKGVKVEGGQYIEHAINGFVEKANGRIIRDINLNVNPSISSASALSIALSTINSANYMWNDPYEEQLLKQLKNDVTATYYPTPELVIMGTLSPGVFVLAYRMEVFSKVPFDRQAIYIDANSGAVLDQFSLMLNCTPGLACTNFNNTQTITTQSTGTEYKLEDACRGGGIQTKYFTNASPWTAVDVTDVDNNWPDGGCASNHPGASAHWASQMTYDYFMNVLGWNSYNGSGANMLSIVNNSANNNLDVDNAYWTGSFIVLGKPQSSSIDHWVSLDVVGHEWTHGVVETTAGLSSSSVACSGCEPVALNESFGDIFGTMIEFYAQDLYDPSNPDDWTLFEDFKNSPSRDMSNPSSKGHPDTYFGTNWSGGVCKDITNWCSAHAKAGVQNYWFYLLSNGGSGTNSKSYPYTYSVTGITKEKAAAIAFRNLTVYLGSSATFFDARDGSIQAAIDLYGCDANEVTQTIEAWKAVGVYDENIPPVADAGDDITCSGTIGPCTKNLCYTYSWSPTDGLDDPNVANPVVSPPAITTTYTLTVTDWIGWVITDDVVVNIPYDYTTLDINADDTWTSPVSIEEKLVIKKGRELIISGTTVSFGPEAELIIERGDNSTRGGRLILDGATLTDYSGCGATMMWNGVQVLGHPNKSQVPPNTTQQGYLEMKNNSVVENSIYGIDLFKLNTAGFTGGIVQATNCTLRNNGISYIGIFYDNFIPVSPFPIVNNASYFSGCTFERTGPLNDPNLNLGFLNNVHAFSWGVDGIDFAGNTFQNTAPGNNVPDRGIGIMSFNANYKVTAKCLDISLPCVNFQPNEFINLYYGVTAYASDMSTVTIDGNEFTDTYRGILLGGVDFATVTSNEFKIADWSSSVPSTPHTSSLPYGLYLEGCTGYQVEENNYYWTASYDFNIGLIVRESGDNYNEIYNNTFDRLWYSIITYDDNDGPANAYDGLEILCNNFVDDVRDIYVIDGDIGDDQGRCYGADITAPAGNRFSHICALGGTDKEEYETYNTTQFIKYHHHTESLTTPPDDRTEPLCFDDFGSGGKVDAMDCNIGWSTDACPPRFDDEGDGTEGLKELITDYEEEAEELREGIDGGDTEELLEVISENESPGDVRDEYLDVSPYVSDQALLAAINDKPTPLPPSILKEIIIANSPVTNQVMDALVNRTPSLPNGVMNEINSVQSGISVRQELEEDILFVLSRRENAVNALIRSYLNDDVLTRTEVLDEVAVILKSEERHSRKSKTLACLIKQREFAKVQQELAAQHPDGVYDNFCKLMSVVSQLRQQVERDKALATEPAMEAEVRALAADVTNTTRFKAQTLLKSVFEESFPEKIILPDQNMNKMAPPEMQEPTQDTDDEVALLEENHTLKNFPNPFGYYTSIEAYVPDHISKSSIEIYTLAGIIVKKYPLVNGYNIVTVLEEDLPSNGVYFYSLLADGRRIATEKMVIVK